MVTLVRGALPLLVRALLGGPEIISWKLGSIEIAGVSIIRIMPVLLIRCRVLVLIELLLMHRQRLSVRNVVE